VNNTGVIEARTVQNHNGTIMLLGDMQVGTVNVGGTLDASAPSPQPSPTRGEGVETPLSLDGRGAGGEGGVANGGFIETSAAHVKIADDAVVTTLAAQGQSGTWLIDPVDFTIASGSGALITSGIGATTLATSLNGGNVSIATDPGTAGNGDIFVNSAVSWSANKLTLTAHRNIAINANLNGSGTAQLALEYGQGAVAAGNTSNYTLNNGAKVNLPAGNNFSTKLGSDGATTTYTVITSLGAAGSVTGTDLQGMNGNLAGNYVLGADIDASATSTWNGNQGFTPVGGDTFCGVCFTGKFDGLGHTINNLFIDRNVNAPVGLFGTANNATLQNVGLLNVSLYGGTDGTGALAGRISGTTAVRNSYADGGSVRARSHYVGGLVGVALVTSSISYSYANVSVESSDGGFVTDAYAGGLVGINNGSISYSYATGSVTGNAANPAFNVGIGGLVGAQNNGGASISNSYATGAVSAVGGGTQLGGLVGNKVGGSITSSYWDKTTTGQASSSGSANTSGLTTAEWSTLGPFGSSPSDGAWSTADWGTGNPYPGIKALPYITITASASQTYGSAATFGIASILDQAGANASGLVNTGGLTWSSDTTTTSAAGVTGNVLGAGATGTGYQILYAGNLTVGQAPLIVTANDASKTYDGLAYSGNNGVAYSGWVNGETAAVLGGALAYGGTSQGAINAGSYLITPSGLTSGNYTISYVNGALTINKAHLTVTADNQSRLYGEANPTFSQTVTGYVNGENATSANVTGSATGSSAATTTSGVGGYVITGSTGTLSAANYDFTAANGTLTINKAHLTVTADNQSRLYGQANPTFSQTIGGYVNGENATSANVTGSATGSSAATALSGVGNYAIVGSTGTLSAANYDFTAADGTLTINKAHLTVTADNQSRLYGQTNPTFSQTIGGYVNGENATSANVTGSASGSSAATVTTGVGNYAIAGSTGTLNAANYDFTAADGTLTINKANATVTANSSTTTYTGLAQNVSGFTASGLVNGETASVLTGVTATGATGTNAGSYANIANGTDGNYNLSFVDGALTIAKANLTVAANNAFKLYDGIVWSGGNGVTYSGFVNGETSAVLGGALVYGGSSQGAINEGSYLITPSGLTSGNYAIAFNDGTLSIGTRIPVIPGVPTDSYSGATDREAGTASVKLSPNVAVSFSANQYVLATQNCGLRLPAGLSCQ